jgi:hypothetical protein
MERDKVGTLSLDWLDALFIIGLAAIPIALGVSNRGLGILLAPLLLSGLALRRKLLGKPNTYVRGGASVLGTVTTFAVVIGLGASILSVYHLKRWHSRVPDAVNEARVETRAREAYDSARLAELTDALAKAKPVDMNDPAQVAALANAEPADVNALLRPKPPDALALQPYRESIRAEVWAENLARYESDRRDLLDSALWAGGFGVFGIGLGSLLDRRRKRTVTA